MKQQVLLLLQEIRKEPKEYVNKKNKTEDNIKEFVLIGDAKTNLKEGVILTDFKAG